MKEKELSLFSLSKIAEYEILIDEQLEQLESVRFSYFKRYLSTKKSLKKRFLILKISEAFIFGILPIIPLIAYFQILDFINERTVSIELILFAGSLLFGIFFIFQFFNFFLMAMLNTMKILSGNIFEWFETLPLSRKKLKKLILLTIIRTIDIPLLAITFSFPVMMLIGTQNLLIFILCIIISILNTIFSFSLLILFCERMNRILNINKVGSRRTDIIRIINWISYIVIVISSVLLIQWSLNSMEDFFVLFVRSSSPTIITLIISMIPFPNAPGYLLSSFISPSQIPVFMWYNILIGLSLFLILVWLTYQKSIANIRKAIKSKFKINSNYFIQNLGGIRKLVRIKVRSPIWAYVYKDLKITIRDLKAFLSILMPIVIGFIFMFTYNSTSVGGLTPFEINPIVNWSLILGVNIFISAMIVYGLLNLGQTGDTIIATLPITPQDQAKAKLIVMTITQALAVLAPSLIYIGKKVFFNFLLTSLASLPFVLMMLLIMFELRIFYFGEKDEHYYIEEINPEKRILKWYRILIREFIIYIAILAISFIIYTDQGLMETLIFWIIFLFIGFTITISIFKRMFPPLKVKKKKLL